MNHDEEVERLTTELQLLNIERDRIERRRRRISDQLDNFRRERRSSRVAARAPQRPPRRLPYRDLSIEENRVDVDGTPLQVEDQVYFLSPGVQTTDKGTITSFGRRFVICTDRNRHVVNKEPHNLRKIERATSNNDRQQ